MKKYFKSFIKGFIVVLLLLVATGFIVSAVSIAGIVVGVIVVCSFIIAIPGLLYGAIKSKK